MSCNRCAYAALLLVLLPAKMLQADDTSPKAEPATQEETQHDSVLNDGTPRADGEPMFFAPSQSPYGHDTVSRVGWPAADREATDIDLGSYEPHVSLDFDYQRFMHRREQDPLGAFTGDTLPTADFHQQGDVHAGAAREPMLLALGQSPYGHDTAFRFGWWGVDQKGSLNRVFEWQDHHNSEFFDLDTLHSDGIRTIDLFATGTDRETSGIGLDFFGPHVSVDFDYQRFLHRREHDPLDAFTDDTPPTSDIYQKNDVNVGDDYAVRVQELHANFKGHVTKNIKWRLNLWGMRKQGERQVNALQHQCGVRCHIQSNGQRIDWLTTEIEPAVEGTFGPVTAEYSRTMRAFNQNDETVSRTYGAFPEDFVDPSTPKPFAVVPENFTEIDRLKLGLQLTDNTTVYSNLLIGQTKNKNRNTHRRFGGADLRLTNQTFDGLSVTGYAKRYEENNEFPPSFPEDAEFTAGNEPSLTARHPVDRILTKAGVRSRWRPFRMAHSKWRRLGVTAGYEYGLIEREYVSYDIPDIGETVILQDTLSHTMRLGTSMRWSACFDTYARYRMRVTRNPLMGLRLNEEAELSNAINSKLAEHEDEVEIGATWTPSESFLMSASIGLYNSHHSSRYINFDEDNYPITLTAWYAPAPRWSLSGGLGWYSNWIDQDISLGINHNVAAVRSQWNYGGRAEVINLGANYAWSERLTLKGTVEHVRANNIFSAPPGAPAGADWSELPRLSDVLSETTRFSAGLDYWLRDGISSYFYYNYFDYNDKAGNGNSGTANMFLGGLTASY